MKYLLVTCVTSVRVHPIWLDGSYHIVEGGDVLEHIKGNTYYIHTKYPYTCNLNEQDIIWNMNEGNLLEVKNVKMGKLLFRNNDRLKGLED